MTIVGSFINALFNFLLGWIRGTAQWLWNMVTSDSHGGLLGWAMRNCRSSSSCAFSAS